MSRAVDVNAETQLVLLLGDPVEHSRSPRIHNTAFRAQDLNAVYLAARVDPARLEAAVEGLRALGAWGANVTIPHKQAVLPLLDRVSERAAAVGAVNTIVQKEEAMLYGDNTDVAGFLAPLEPFEAELHGAEALVFGAGGAARAVAYALVTAFRPSRLTLAVRRPARAEQVVADLSAHDSTGALDVMPLREAAPRVRASRLVVNATPLGMHPKTEGTPWPHPKDFSEQQLAYDLVYTPRRTRFLREAAARGATPIGGMEMLLGQAAAAYEQWTGRAFPLEAVQRVLPEERGMPSETAFATSTDRARQVFEGYLAKSAYLSAPAFFDEERAGFVVVHSGHNLKALGGEMPTVRYFARRGVWVELLDETGPGPFADARHFGPRGDGRLWEYKTPEPGGSIRGQVQRAIHGGKRPSGNIVVRVRWPVNLGQLNRGVNAALVHDRTREQPLVRILVVLYETEATIIEERRTAEEFYDGGNIFRGP